jgi:hypothetical protein
MLTVLDEVDRTLAIQGGWSEGADRGSILTVCERHQSRSLTRTQP